MDDRDTVDVPGQWDRIEYLCYPHRGSKAYKHQSGANVHIIEMGSTYHVQLMDDGGTFEEERFVPYREAVRIATDWMEDYEPPN